VQVGRGGSQGTSQGGSQDTSRGGSQGTSQGGSSTAWSFDLVHTGVAPPLNDDSLILM